MKYSATKKISPAVSALFSRVLSQAWVKRDVARSFARIKKIEKKSK